MALDTYDNLKTAIADHLDRSDLSSHIDDFIDIAEARHKDEIRMREMLTRTAITIDQRYEDLPEGFLAPLTLRILTTPLTNLTYVNQARMDEIRKESTGKPQWFTIHAQIEFDVAADSSYSGEMIYWKEFTALSDSNVSNDLLTRSPGCYLYGALAAAAPFLMHDERLPVWNTMYETCRNGVNASANKGRHAGPLIATPPPGMP